MSGLKHRKENRQKPKRVVLLGAQGFIGKSLARALEKEGISTLSLGRSEVDLGEKASVETLSLLLQEGDSVVFLATLTPDKGRGTDAFIKNVQIGANVCAALAKVPPAHLIYLGSDTVYSLNRGLITEDSPLDPENLFGAMHVSREHMIKGSLICPMAFLRSTLVYGFEDTHNSYGPNRIRRMAQKDRKITLFGKGEEKRDHIYIEDLTQLVLLSLFYQSTGVLNLVTGNSISYFELAQKIAMLFDDPIEIICTERNNSITHRHFDAASIYKAFPSFCFTPLEEGLRKVHAQEMENRVCTS